MKQTREINHGDGHTDIETLFGEVWAVTKCNLEVTMFDGYTESQAQTNARAAHISAEVEQREIRDAMIAEVAPMFDTLRAAVAGTYTADADGVDMIDVWNWQIEDLEQATNSFMTESQAWKDEAEALAADARNYDNQVSELRGGG